VWDAASGRPLLTLQGHNDTMTSVGFSSDGRRIITASADRTVKVWDAASGRQLLTLSGHGDGVSSAEFSPNGQEILDGSYDGKARLWNAARDEQVREWQAEEAEAEQRLIGFGN